MINRAEDEKQRRSVGARRGGVRACAIVVSMPLMAWSTGKDTICPGRLGFPLGLGFFADGIKEV